MSRIGIRLRSRSTRALPCPWPARVLTAQPALLLPRRKPAAWLASAVLLLGSIRLTTAAFAAELTLVSRTVYQGSQLHICDGAGGKLICPGFSGRLVRDLDLFAEWLEVGGWSFGPDGNLDA